MAADPAASYLIDFSAFFGSSGRTRTYNPSVNSLQSELRRIYRIWVTLVELFAGDKAVARQFLNAPNRALDRRAPIEFIEKGDLGPLEMYVDSMTARQPI